MAYLSSEPNEACVAMALVSTHLKAGTIYIASMMGPVHTHPTAADMQVRTQANQGRPAGLMRLASSVGPQLVCLTFAYAFVIRRAV